MSDKWVREDTHRGIKCIYSEELGFDIYLTDKNEIIHIEDIKRGTSFNRSQKLKEDLMRLNELQKLITEDSLKWEK